MTDSLRDSPNARIPLSIARLKYDSAKISKLISSEELCSILESIQAVIRPPGIETRGSGRRPACSCETAHKTLLRLIRSIWFRMWFLSRESSSSSTERLSRAHSKKIRMNSASMNAQFDSPGCSRTTFLNSKTKGKLHAARASITALTLSSAASSSNSTSPQLARGENAGERVFRQQASSLTSYDGNNILYVPLAKLNAQQPAAPIRLWAIAVARAQSPTARAAAMAVNPRAKSLFALSVVWTSGWCSAARQ